MIITDTLSNFFSKIKNGFLAKKYKITQYKSKQIINILNILIKEGLIKSYKVSKKKNIIYIYLKYKNNISIISKIIRISKPSKRIYIKNKDLFKIKKKGIYILSTSYGVVTDLQAKKLNLGGELICNIY
ncbi:ribosomal protein S8 (mitochondrion) [Saprolegnia parasitica CBS 223.65]|uniref:Ribosomal protein S8 n=2 Tax=Saprolegnia TaxID=4769 RepID=A0A067BBJ2_SAPPC|nr:ribosomal protein S8 [Saprolegnia ferax]XP_012213619.1 ribosomal protein S8 [Saprolegnia parasitica CBS 223.65]AAT40659.1 ribosomal protein S8 [Saprolegnia ferax]KDO15689.1 ribosomal protein S8 [Saprolegnia parasitica CBS 223.65]|eukprot:XP_012213619.1 ribosomal protein S8 (mitochondrion) [Saprolegnia parasitica CBS 223.65]